MTKILIVDDDPVLRDYLHHVLNPRYPDLVDAETIEEAWQQFEQQEPDLVLLDLNLPDGDGLELCLHIHAWAPLLPVLILTARNQVQDRVNGLESGADDYIIKPFEPEELLARVVSLLQ